MKKKRRLLQSDMLWGGLVLLLIILQFWWLPGEDGSAADSYSNTIDGKLGLYRTLSQLFPEVTRDTTRVVPEKPDATILLISPDRYPTDAEQQTLYQYVYNGGNLLFAPRWLESPAFVEQGKDVQIPRLGIRISPRHWMENAFRRASQRAGGTGTIPATPVTSDGAADAGKDSTTNTSDPESPDSKSPGMQESTDGEPSGAQPTDPTVSDSSGPVTTTGPDGVTPSGTTPDPSKAEILTEEDYGDQVKAEGSVVSGSVELRTTGRVQLPSQFEGEVLLTSGEGDVDAATWNVGMGRVVVCSTADIFSNRSMLYPQERRLAVRLVERCAARVDGDLPVDESSIVIAEFFNTSDAYQNAGILFSPAMRVGSLQLLLVTVLSIWMAFHRFGPAQHVTTSQRRSLTESAEAVGNLQYRLSDGGAVIHGYLEYIRSQLRRRYGSLLRLEQPDAIANRADMNETEVKDQLKEAHELARTASVTSSKTASTLRWLSHLQQRLSGRRDEK